MPSSLWPIVLSLVGVGCDLVHKLRYTDHVIRLEWNLGGCFPTVSGRAERRVAPSLVVEGEYIGHHLLSPERMKMIEASCAANSMRVEQALSMRKQLLVQKILTRNSALKKNLPAMKGSYERGVSILRMSERMDQPPMAIFRLLLYDRVRSKFQDLPERDIKLLIKEALREQGDVYESLMDARDKEELTSAKLNDQTSYSVDPNERLTSLAWEHALYSYLDERGTYSNPHSQ